MVGPITLRELVEIANSLNGEWTVFRKPEEELSVNSVVFVVNLDEEDEPEGLREFIDIWHISDVIAGKSRVFGLNNPDVAVKVDLLIDYVKNGA